MRRIIQQVVRKPFFKQVLKEWSLCVKTKQDPTVFANLYMEMMRDPLHDDGRKMLTMFISFVRTREWPQVMRIIRPKLQKDVAKIFRTRPARDFYDGFKAMVIEQIRDYWAQFLAARKAKAEEIGPRDWSPRTGKCLCKKVKSDLTCPHKGV